MTTLCEDCFPDWREREQITSSVINRCEGCGQTQESGARAGVRIRCHAFRTDPRKPRAALLREKDTKQ